MHQGLRLSRLWLALVVGFFCLPLFVGLGGPDIVLDEAIYSFAVDRILETGDWLEPKSSPNEDWAFLEKPPLKFWLVAAPIKLGLLPHTAYGIRFWDALFGALALLYVFAIGSRLGGPVTGAAAVLLLFAHHPLLFDHGLRSNNMESPLVLAYCGGVYHFLAWTTATTGPARWRHVLGVAAGVVLGFMTKFVAVVFLPLVLGVAVVSLAEVRRAFVRDLRLWMVSVALALAVTAPWFVWATNRYGWFLWETMLGAHVYARFTAYLDPAHVQPWHYYYSQLWLELHQDVTRALVIGGVLALLVLAVKRRSVDAVVVLLWATLPLALISAGTSKLYHYAYPFLPPLALGTGYLTSLPIVLRGSLCRRALDTVSSWRFRRDAARRPTPVNETWLASRPWARRMLGLLATTGLLVASYTALFGPIALTVGETPVFRSSGLLRPLTVAIVFGVLSGTLARTCGMIVVILVLGVLPLRDYRASLQRLTEGTSPFRDARECLLRVQSERSGPGLYVDVPPEQISHGLYYNFRRVRPWTRRKAAEPDMLARYLGDGPEQRPALVSESVYRDFIRAQPRGSFAPPAREAFDGVLLLMPGPYAACVAGPFERGARTS